MYNEKKRFSQPVKRCVDRRKSVFYIIHTEYLIGGIIMLKSFKVLFAMILLCAILCACAPSPTGTASLPATSDTQSYTSTIAAKIAGSTSVHILYLGANERYEKEVYTTTDTQIIHSFADALKNWDPQKNQTQCMDTACSVTLIFDEVKINCNITGDLYGVISQPEPNYYMLPQTFIDVVKQYIPA